MLFKDPTKFLQMTEPYSPVIDGQILDDFPFNLISKGEIRPNTPVVFGLQKDEGEMFMAFAGPFVKKVT